MKPSIQKLQKFLKLEAERGYDNRAVVGGLDKIIDLWESEARADEVPEDLIQAVTLRLRDYPNLSPTSRAEALEGLWRRINREFNLPDSGLAHAKPAAPQTAPKPHPVPAEPEASPVTITAPEPDSPRLEPVMDATGEMQPDGSTPQSTASASIPSPVTEPKKGPDALDASVTVLHGVGPRHGHTLGHLGIRTLGDLLYYFPRRYDDYSRLLPINRLHYGDEATVIGAIQSVAVRPVRSGRQQLVEAVVNDGTAALRINWFNQPWTAKRLHGGANIVLSGKLDQYLGRLVMNNPEWEPLEQQQLNTNRIVPVYPLTANITQRWLRRLLYQVVSYWAPRFLDPLPENIRKDSRLMDLSTALLQVHFPDSWDLLNAARQRLAFDEILFLQLGVLRQKYSWQSRSARKFTVEDSWLQGQVERLPYVLTGAQQRTLQDLRSDLASSQPMNRLLQGDVGSGKTVMAALAIALVTQTGAQAAVMAPTSILAEQHYKTLLQLLCGEAPKLETPPEEEAALQSTSAADPGLSLDQVEQPGGETYESEPSSENEVDLQPSPAAGPVLSEEQVRLLIGSTPEAEKAEIRSGLASGSIKLVVGTHALLEDPVGFADLQLAIIDEQHRFGVQQRAALRSKGENLHLLVMTATPIPRSLALTVYGDLDVTVLDEMPPGRQEIATYLLEPRERERAYQLVRHQVALGRQAFIIYPLVAESEASEAKAAVEEQARLQDQIFPDLQVGLLHGRMRPEEKDDVMERFRSGEYHVLVSTSVVEVGVDIPNATLMIIEGANRFGLAQLHQFRGRVGRGADKSYCLLIPDASEAVENERLKVMVETNDGFILAEKDLQQRGPGQFLGTRQSGFNELRMASLTDVQLIEKARRVAQAINLEDPELASPEHQVLAQSLSRFWTVSSPVERPAGEVFPAADIS